MLQKMERNKRLSWHVLIPIAVSVLILMICTKSSFLYPMNDWVDVNCYFTVGRGVKHGLIPYLDLYEQKGPLVYFLYALAAWISEDSFIGVFCVECVCFALFLHFSGRTALAISRSKGTYLLTVSVLGLAVPLSKAFSHGGSAEELILPVLALGLMTVMEAMEAGRGLSCREAVLLGICTFIALFSKYTFCGLFAGLALLVLIFYVAKGRGRELPMLIGAFLAGVLLPTGVLILWFWTHGALWAMIKAYFVNNLALYSKTVSGGRYDPPLANLLNNLSWSVPGVIGLVLLWGRRGKRWEAAAALSGAVCLFVFTYISGRRYPYYALVLSVFACIGFGCAAEWLCRREKHRKMLEKGMAAASILAVLAGPLLAYKISGNTYLLGASKDEMPQYRFAEIIGQAEDQSLLNSGFLDGGFYFAAGVLPSEPFFCTLNIRLDEMEEALEESIAQGKTAFVVTRSRELKHGSRYRLVDSCSYPFEGRTWKYYLYQRIDG